LSDPYDNQPTLLTELPGPRSRALGERLARVESPNVTVIGQDWPLFLERGEGAFIVDVDGNRLLDMTGCFAVAALGQGATAATRAGAEQLCRLAAGMGDIHPTEAKVLLLEKLAELAPFPGARTLLGCNGVDAVEAALKTVRLTTGRPGVISFTGGYHGLSIGALGATAWGGFRQPFSGQMPDWGAVAAYPDPFRRGDRATEYALENVVEILDSPIGPTLGGIIVEPIQGRGGDVVPPDDFLPELRTLADRRDLLLIFDEIYTGLGRTGRLWACDHVNVAPDLLLAGKALGGGFPISACIGNARAMAGWPADLPEALHTYTHLGNPIGCTMGLASIERILDQDLPAAAARLGRHLQEKLCDGPGRLAPVGEVRGRGLMTGVELVADRQSKQPDSELAVAAMKACLARGLLILTAGTAGNILSFSPPLTVTEAQLDTAVTIVEDVLRKLCP
jgi:4-aminobutyrate aminotransferase-like enzyme